MRKLNIAFETVFGVTLAGLVACGRPATTPPPITAPTAEVLPSTISAADAARADGREDLFERGLIRLTDSAEPAIRRQALVRLALYHSSKDRHANAAASLRQAIPLYPELAPYLKLRLLQAEAAAGNNVEALRSAQTIELEGRGTPAGAFASILLPQLYARAGDRANASRTAKALESAPIDEFSEPLILATANELEKAGISDSAASLRLSLLRRYPQGRYIEPLYADLRKLGAADPLDQLSFEESLDLAERLGRFNRYDQSLDFLARIEPKFPEKSASASFRFVKTQALFNSRNYEEVKKISWKKDEPYYLASELLRARAHWRSDGNREFVQTLERLIDQYPKTKEATQAKLLLGKYNVTDVDEPEKAAAYYRVAISEGGAGEQGEHLWNLAWIEILGDKNNLALATLDRYLASYPDADYTSNALFWAGKVHAKRNEAAKRDASWQRLIQLYPFSYYSHRARELMGASAPKATESNESPAFPAIAENWNDENDARLAVVRELLAIGLDTEAASELKIVAAQNPDDARLAFRLAELYSRIGEPMKAMGVLQRRFREIVRHGGKNVPQRFWEILFPRHHWERITAAAAKRDLDPYLMTSIIRQESGFEPTVVSSAGAVGLMQIMPAEAQRISTDDGQIGSVTREQLFNPDINVEVGAAEIVQKMKAMNGNILLAIASYNAGEDAVGRWLTKTSLADIDVFIESIPYAETRLYVKSVMRNQHEYRRIYEQERAIAASR